MKLSVDDLAILGGTAEFEEPLHVGQPSVGDEEALFRRIQGAIGRRWVTNDGPLVREFEARLESLLGVRHCLATANGTVGLEIAIRALELEGEVILPAFTFAATAHALEWLGVQPVFADVRPSDYTLDPKAAAELITPRTTGILGVHLWGRPCDVAELTELGERHSLRVIFDAAHAIGMSAEGVQIGGFGEAEVFSFHATKIVNAFEGGAITTNDDALAEKIRKMRNFGFAGIDTVEMLGTNGKMSEISAAMGLTSLDAFAETVQHNEANYRHYKQCFDSLDGLSLLEFDSSTNPNYQYIVVLVDREQLGLSRDDAINLLWQENVLARRYFYPGLHKVEPYQSRPTTPGMLTVTDRLSEQVMVLPTGNAIGVAEVARVCALLTFVSTKGSEIAERLHGKC